MSTTDEPETAEPDEHVRRALEKDYYPDGAQRLMNYLWEHPEEFSTGADLGNVDEQAERFGMGEHAYIAVTLGVLFGVKYEHAYPTACREAWPVAIEDRPTNAETCEKVYRCGGCERIFDEPLTHDPDGEEYDEERCPFCGNPTSCEETKVRHVAF